MHKHKNKIINTINILVLLSLGLFYSVTPLATRAAMSGGGFEMSGETILPIAGTVGSGNISANLSFQPAIVGQGSGGPFTVVTGAPIVTPITMTVTSSSGSANTVTNGGGNSYYPWPTSTPSTATSLNAVWEVRNVVVNFVGDTFAYIAFETTQPAKTAIAYSDGVSALNTPLTDSYELTHTIFVSGLTPQTRHSFSIYADFVNHPPVLFQNPTYEFVTTGKNITKKPASTNKVPSPVVTPENFNGSERAKSQTATSSQTGSGVPITQPINFGYELDQTKQNARLSWSIGSSTDPSKIDFTFELYRSKQGYLTSPQSDSKIYDGKEFSHIDRNLVPGEKYFYTLFTKSASGVYSVGYPLLIDLQEHIIAPTTTEAASSGDASGARQSGKGKHIHIFSLPWDLICWIIFFCFCLACYLVYRYIKRMKRKAFGEAPTQQLPPENNQPN